MAADPSAETEAAPIRHRPLWPRLAGILAGMALLAAALAAVLWWVAGSDWGRRTAEAQLRQALEGGRISIGAIEGSLRDRFTLRDIRVRDRNGVWLIIPEARVDWDIFRLLAGNAHIRSLTAPLVLVARVPESEDETPFVWSTDPLLPAPPVSVSLDRLTLARVMLAPAVAGVPATLSAQGSAMWSRLGVLAPRLIVTDDQGTRVQLNGAADLVENRLSNARLSLNAPNPWFLAIAEPDLRARNLRLNVTADGPLTSRWRWLGARATLSAERLYAPRLDAPIDSLNADAALDLRMLDKRVRLNRLDVRLPSLSLSGHGAGDWETRTGSGAVSLDIADLKRWSALAGRPLSGAGRITLDASLPDVDQPIEARLTTDLRQLKTGIDLADQWLAGRLSGGGSVSRAPDGALAWRDVRFTAGAGGLSTDGALSPAGVFSGQAQLDARRLVVNGSPIANLRLTLTPRGRDATQFAAAALTELGPATLAAFARYTDKRIALQRLEATLPGLRLTGALVQTPAGPFAGRLLLVNSGAQNRAGIGVSGDIRLEVGLGAAGGDQTVALDGRGRSVRLSAKARTGAIDRAEVAVKARLRTGGATGSARLAVGGARLAALAVDRLDANVNVSGWTGGAQSYPLGNFDLSGDGLRYGDIRVGGVSATARVTGWTAALPVGVADAALTRAVAAGATIERARLTARLAGGGGTAHAALNGRRGYPVAATADATFSTRGSRQSASILLDARVDNRVLRTTAPLTIAHSPAGWRVDAPGLALADGNLSGVLVSERNGWRISGDVVNLDLGLATLASPGFPARGRMAGHADLRGDRGGATGGFDLRVRNLRSASGGRDVPPLDVAAQGRLSPNMLATTLTLSGGQGIGGGADVTVPLMTATQGGLPTFARARPLSGRFNAAAPLAPLWALTGEEDRTLSGQLRAQGAISGTLDQPALNGQATLANGRVLDTELGLDISGIEAKVGLDGRRVTLASLTGRARGGTISGSGAIDLLPTLGYPGAIRLTTSRAELVRRDSLRLTATSDLTLTSGPEGASVTGTVGIDRAEVSVAQPGSDTIAKLEVRHVNRPADLQRPPATTASLPPVRLSITVRADNQIFVRGRGLESEWRAALTVGGSAKAPIIAGPVTLVRGEYEFAGKAFKLTRGTINFTGAGEPDPTLDIQAETTTQDLTAIIQISGTATKPVITFSSTPVLPQDEILSRLLFGTSVANLSPLDAAQLATALASLSSGGGGFDPIGKLRRTVGLDRLRLNSGEGGASITGGTYLGKRVFLEVTTGLTGQTLASIEWAITRTLSILTSVDQLGRNSVQLEYKRDY